MKYSIIIPFKYLNLNLKKNLNAISNLKYKDFEVILIPDEEITINKKYNYSIKVITSGKVMPGIKRDMAAKVSSGDILAFIDDDAFPTDNWLDIASKYFDKKKYLALGGPGIDDSYNNKNLIQKLSDTFFKSEYFGFPERYMSIGVNKYLDDWPSVNLLISKDIYLKVGGFDTNHWPGEDTVLCSKLKKIGVSIFYVPQLIVHHVRRISLKKLFFQLFNYGDKRAKFFFEFPNNSRKIIFFIPTFFTLYIFSIFFFFDFIYLIPLVTYITIAIVNYLKVNKFNNTNLLFLFPFFCAYCHISYGVGYLIGFIKKLIGYKN